MKPHRRTGLPLAVSGPFFLQAALAAILLMAAPARLHSATQVWNPPGGGNGTWNAGITADWDTGATWTNSNDAIFSGTGGTVTVVNPVADSVTFQGSGPYLLQSGTLTLASSLFNMTMNSNATIASDMFSADGVGLSVTGLGELTLTGTTNLGSNLTVDYSNVDIANGGIVSGTFEGGGDIDYGGTVSVSGSGSKWVTNSFTSIYIGDSGSGGLNIDAGGAVSTGYSLVGYNFGAVGEVTVSGTGSTWTNNDYLYIGFSGSGNLLITNGGVASGDSSFSGIAYMAGSGGMVTITGTGSKWTNAGGVFVGGSEIGPGGNGRLTITNGGAVSGTGITVYDTGTLALGENPKVTAPLILDGGVLTLVDGQIQPVTLTSPATITALSTLDFEIGNGSDELTHSGGGSITFTGTANLNLYPLTGQVASGTDVLIGAATSGRVSLTHIYNTGNFIYTLLSTATSEDVVVTATTPLTTAYWKGSQDNLWDDAVNGASTNWATDVTGTSDTHLTPSATTDVIFSTNNASNEGNTFLGASITIASLSINDPNPVAISGVDPSTGSNTDTLTISGTVGILVGAGSGQVTLAANTFLSGISQTVAIEDAAGAVVSGSLGGSFGLYVGGNSAGPSNLSFLSIGSGGIVSATETTIWGTGTLELGQNATLNSPLLVNGGTVTLVDGQLETFTLTYPGIVSAGSNLDFDVGAGSDRIALSGSGSLTITGTSSINLFCIAGAVTSGTDILVSATGGKLALGNVYNGGNFTYSVLTTSSTRDLVVTATTPLTTAYWKGSQNNVWSLLVGGTASNWATTQAGTTDPHLTPSSTTNVYFSAASDVFESDTVLGENMTINSLTISDSNPVVIAGSNPASGTQDSTLTISPNTNSTGVTINAGAGAVTFYAGIALGSDQTWTNNSANPLIVKADVTGTSTLYTTGTGTIILAGNTSTGMTAAENGKLVITGTLSSTTYGNNGSILEVDGALYGDVSVANSTLQGRGYFYGNGNQSVSAGGTFAPGYMSGVSTTGTLTVNTESVDLSPGEPFSIRLGVLNASDNDQLAIEGIGTVELNSATLELTLGPSINNPANIGMTWIIINGGAGQTGQFGNTFSQGTSFTTPGGFLFFIDYASGPDGSGTGNDVVLQLAAIPEPSTWAMILSGLALLPLFRRRTS